MQEHMTADEYRAIKKSNPSKYHNRRTEYNGIVYDSAAEAYRAATLDLLIKAGEIKSYRRQPVYTFKCGVRYVSDFEICGKSGETWCEDVKSLGTVTAAFRLKFKLMKDEYPDIPVRVIDKYGNLIGV